MEIRIATWILMLAADPAHARSLARELAATSRGRAGPLIPRAIRMTVVLALHDIRRSLRDIGALVLLAYATAGALAFLFLVLPGIVLQRPPDGSLFSTWWIRDLANAASGAWGSWIFRNLIGPLLLGAIVACFTRGREVAAFLAVLLSEIVAQVAAAIYAGDGSYNLAVLLLYIPRNYVPIFAGVVLVRFWRLSREAQPPLLGAVIHQR